MNDEEILKILVDWNFWEKDVFIGIRREHYVKTIQPFLETNQAIVIGGVRRSGKSTIVLQLFKHLIDSGFNPKDILIVNFEDYRLYDISLNLLGKIYELFLRKISRSDKRVIFLDEVHKIGGWERFVRTLIDKREAKMIISGSNSKLISTEYAQLLTGRHVNLTIMPLSFKEFLFFRGLDISDEIKLLANERKLRNFLDEFIIDGGFPEIVLSNKEARKKILIDCFESIITKDVVERYKIRDKEKLMVLSKYYLTNVSTKVSFNKLKDYLNMPLATVERFSHYLEDAYLICFLKRFSFKVKEQEKAQRKVYVIDNGLANALGFKFSQDYGRLMENLVFLEIKKAGLNDEVYYWQNLKGEEVDFVVKEGLKVKQLIQVCYDINHYETKEREIKALLKASRELKCNNLLVITDDKEGEEKIKDRNVKFIPLWKWLLK